MASGEEAIAKKASIREGTTRSKAKRKPSVGPVTPEHFE